MTLAGISRDFSWPDSIFPSLSATTTAPGRCRRAGADRRRRSGIHGARSGRNLLPRLPPCRIRHLRIVDVELHGQDRAGNVPLCRRAGLRVARLPPHLDLCAYRPHQEAGRPQGQKGRRAGISIDRQCLGARHSGRRSRRQAVRPALDPRRAGGSGAGGENRHHAAQGREARQRAGRPHAVCHAGGGRDRRLHRAAGAVRFRRATRISAGCSPIRSLPPRITTSAPAFSRSCI